MNPIMTSLIISTLALGTIITLSSYHWLLAWVGLELNTLAIIPIIAKQHNPRATEAATKYFLTQAAASAMLLFASTTNAWTMGTWNITEFSNQSASIMLTTALAMKLGLAPLHFWLPEVLQGTTFKTALIITTWQKLAPLTLLYLTHNTLHPMTLLIMAMLSNLVGGWGGLNQTQTRKIMAFSSIAHLGWMAAILMLAPNIMLLTLSLYIFITLPTFMLLMFSSAKTIQDLTTSWTITPTTTALILILLMSLGGLPPLTGFLPKWLILQELTSHSLTPMATMMAMTALLSLFFYLRLTYMTTLTLHPTTTQHNHKWRFYPKLTTTPLSAAITISTLLLPMTPMLT
uniref:NADH-ubiquinone oxidoreductase chain 2 n=1 Tax=Ablepharus ladacensis TaxID=3147706 RepID=A0A975ISQ0_9SAUR|nr:NADH dehydrogenase subunit 2 [Asymblepharus ladacensis]QTZ20798.1 NADH dehydrogenase subunit 2 [Asymblepharus ladacensis]QTZ20799.1 NADH dehydrogenase subunit 2 [Asymblepharus ladacensis]